MKPDSATQRGSAVLMVLGMAGLLAVLALLITGSSGAAITVTRYEQARIEAGHIADGALQRLILALLDNAQRARLPMDGTALESRFLGRQIAVSVEDEWGKLDINRAPLDLLGEMFRLSGLGTADRAALLGALSAGRDQAGPGVKAFDSLDALRRAAGIPAETFSRAVHHMTVYSKAGLVDPWAARTPVLAAVTGAPADEINAFVLARSGAARPRLPDVLAARYLASSPSQFFTIHATVPMDDGRSVRRSMTLSLSRGPEGGFEILDAR